MSSDRTLVLTGLMGAGKSTVGRLLADRLRVEFVDTDELVEQSSGKTIAQVFASEGEAGFRRREAECLARALSNGGSVVAAGGGAVVDSASRQRMRSGAEVVWLTAPVSVLADRVGDGGSRPLLSSGVAETLARLLDERAAAYADCDRRVDTAGRSAEEVADAVQGLPLRAYHHDHEYPVHVLPGGPDLGEAALRQVFPDTSRVFVVADRRAAELHGDGMADALRRAGYDWDTVRLEPGEGSKGLGAVTGLWRRMAASAVDRDVPLLAFGGGITTDIGGFAAACWKRGVPWVAVSTTLLGMVDAAVGGKTGVNLHEGKNLVGAFHPPSLVLLPIGVLATLPDRDLRGALGEVVKTALIGDVALLDLLEREHEAVLARAPDVLTDVVRRCVAVKAAIVREDPDETTGRRRALNLGHTVGHAIEQATQYARYTHGEAVALGLVVACRMAVTEGDMTAAQAERVVELLARLGLPTDTSVWAGDGVESWRNAICQDKKVINGHVRYLLPVGIGSVREVALEPDDLLDRLRAATNSGGYA